MGDYSGQSVIKGKDNVLVKQSHSLDSAQMLQSSGLSHSLSRPLELAGRPGVGWDPVEEVEALRRELETVRRRQQTAEEEALRLQAALARKSQECQELVQSRETIQRQADRQVQELEEALGDVQKRMLDSEAKVKQLQAHVVAVKEHLGGQAADELRAQLHDVKAKYEGASAEVGRVRNHLKQSEKALEEYKSSEGQLAVEAERLGLELTALREERDELAEAVLDMEALIKETRARQGEKVVPAEKFDNMKNLLSNAVDEKERQLAELREDYDRVLEEVAELHREMDSQQTQAGTGAVPLQEHERMRTTLEEQSSSMKRRLADITAKSQALIRQVEESEEEREMLQEQLEELNSRVEANFIPLKAHKRPRAPWRELWRSWKRGWWRPQKGTARPRCRSGGYKRRGSPCVRASPAYRALPCPLRSSGEVGALNARNAELVKELEVLQKRFEEREKELAQVTAKNQSLKQSLNGEYVFREKHEQVNSELSAALEKAKAELSKVEKESKESEEELQKVKEGSAELKEKLENVQVMIENDYVCLIDHEAVRVKLSNAVVEAEHCAKEALASYQSAQDGTVKLHQEMEAQKKELDTIQEAIQAKFVPLTAVEERENSYNTKLKDLTGKLSEMQEKYNQEKLEGERHKQEKEKLKVQMESVQQRMETGFVASEKHKEVEDEYRGKMEELTLRLVDLEQQYKDVTVQRAELEEQNALCNTDIQSLQQRLESESARLEHYEAEHRALRSTIHQAQDECQKAREAQRMEAQRACALEKELQGCSGDQAVLLQQHAQAKEALEGQVAQLLASLRQEQETSAQRAQNVAALQSELLRATQSLDELGGREDQLSQLKAEKQRLQEETAALGERLSGLAEQCEVLHHEVAQAREDEGRAREGQSRARVETEALQEKSNTMDKEIRELKERYEESLSTIGEFQRRIQMSAEQTEVKDKKISELLTDVERLKQALNGLSQLAYAGNAAPNKRQTQHIDTLQAQIKSLQQQLAVSVCIYICMHTHTHTHTHTHIHCRCSGWQPVVANLAFL
nr:LOW QUALITY PROTEIN: uveal autoantigen with coiled-coil domains and ankyrin repeats-like [Oncorhynchus nerka]